MKDVASSISDRLKNLTVLAGLMLKSIQITNKTETRLFMTKRSLVLFKKRKWDIYLQ